MSFRMDMQTVIELIEAVKHYPSLYSKDPSPGNNIDQKNIIWKDISLKIDQPVEKCKAKWRNLRDSYQKAVKWRQELEQIGKVENYHEYKHEAALSFLECGIGVKRKAITLEGDKRSKASKRLKEETSDVAYNSGDNQDFSPIEYLIETDPNDNVQDDNDDEEVSEQEELLFAEELQVSKVTNERTVTPTDLLGDIKDENYFNEVAADEIVYQDSLHSSTIDSIDSWLLGIKGTLLSFPKLLRARAKKEINDLVSNYEIAYLETQGN